MAFLPTILGPALGGLASGMAATAGGLLVNKIVGDAPPEMGLTSQVPPANHVQQNSGNSQLQQLSNPSTSSQLNPNPSATMDLMYPLSASMNPNSSQNAMLAAQSANILGQSASDAAALLANGHSHLQEARAFREGTLPPTPQNASYLIQQQLSGSVPRSIPYTQPYALNAVSPQAQGVSNANAVGGVSITAPIPTNSELIPWDGRSPASLIQTAPQPRFKTFDNQSVNIPVNDVVSINNPVAAANSNPFSIANNIKLAGREIAHGAMLGATNALDQVAANAGTQAMNLAGRVVTRGAAKVGSTIQTAIGGMIKKIIGDAPPMEQPPAWANELINGQFRIDPQVLKIVGDALPNMLSSSPAFMSGVKIVGDAPPLENQPGMMTQDQMEAARNNIAGSSMFQLMAKVILQEQTLETASGLVLGLNVRAMNKAYGTLLAIVSGSFDQSATRVVNGLQGCTMIPTLIGWWLLYVDEAKLEWVVHPVTVPSSKDIAIYGITAVETSAPKVAPPLGGNTTLETLKPLLLGAATTDYSSQLRVSTSLTNVDSMMRAVALASNQIAAQSGYSFALPLIKALGYLIGFNPILGQNLSSFMPGLNMTFTQDWQPGVYRKGTYENGWYPWTGTFPLQTASEDFVTSGGETKRPFKAAVLTERDFVLYLSSGVSDATWDEDLHIANWGTRCAIVFIPPGSHNNGRVNLVRLLCATGFPFCMYGPAPNRYTYYANMYDAPSSKYQFGSLATPTSEGISSALPKPFLTRIPGPTRAVIFVVLGNYERISSPIVSIRGDEHTIGINGIDNGPSTPFVMNFASPEIDGSEGKDFINFLSNQCSQPAILAYIREWESFFGNNSDRATALRFWAEHSRLYGFQPKTASNVDIGSQQITLCNPVINYLNGVMPANWPLITGMPDIPVHLQGKAAVDKNEFMRLNFELNTTATGLLTSYGRVVVREVTLGGKKYNVDNVDTSNFNSVTVVPINDVLIDYLCYKKWVYPLEEYPTTLLSDAARISLTVGIMSNMLAAGTDNIYQSNSIGVTPFYIPSAVVGVENVMLMLSRQVWPTVESMFNMGIQFPSVYNIRDGLTNYVISGDVSFLYAIHFTNPLSGGDSFSSIARIPRELVGQWVPSLQPIWNRLRLNIPAMKPSRSYLTTTAGLRSMFSFFVCPDDTGLTPAQQSLINSLLSRISQGVIALGLSRNVGFLARNVRDSVVRPYFFSIRHYNEYRDQLIVSAMGGSSTLVPAFVNIGLPVVEAVCVRDYVAGFSPIRFVSSGPVDAFGPGDGSYGYIMYYNMSGGFSTITTNTHATVPDSVYTGDGMSNFLNFL